MAEPQKDSAEGKKSSKKLIIIIIAVVILLAGAGAGYYFFMRDNHSTGDEGSKKSKKSDHSKNKSESNDKEPPGEMLYYDLGKPLVVNFSKSASARLVSISLSFLVEGPETEKALKKNEPMIRNDLLMLMNGQGAEKLNTLEGKEQLRAAILTDVAAIMEKMTEKNRVKDVFFTSFVMQ